MDRETFVIRTEALRQRLYRTAYLYLGSESDALEAVDEAVYQALQKLRDAAFFDTWLTRILINECHKELRRRKRFFRKELGEFPEEAGPDVYDALLLREAVGRLPEDLRSVIVLRFFGGYTQAETGEILGIPQGTVATRQRRALQLLRFDLEEEEFV